ncbi:MAG: hypothetical protein FFODKBPE_00143 [Candidatus Argoarchaeum ethanivorans]|uniref:Uncharacterized protein n=1 Tax=Candidatus Argoarchaeum ethanivorans TaxID=2608793 RepID=A0A811T6W0_9EURY|nr:MAG: hypothetical protein FFODKBPE_00143 [Candidatus Argoarchaeum ethanivorans]
MYLYTEQIKRNPYNRKTLTNPVSISTGYSDCEMGELCSLYRWKTKKTLLNLKLCACNLSDVSVRKYNFQLK